jgi:hypothetical protein
MSAKIGILDELKGILTNKKKRDEEILAFSKRFNINQILRPFSDIKKRGYTLTAILTALILTRLGGMSVRAMQQTGCLEMDDNTMYRCMNSTKINWKSVVLAFAKQFLKLVLENGDPNENATKCYVIDDTDIEKTGRTFEGLSKIHSHAKGRYIFGFKLLLLSYWDGKSLIPCGFSLHRENKKNNFGLSERQRKKQFDGKRKEEGFFREYREDLDESKPAVAVRMLKQCVKCGILAKYVLMDSWFVSDSMLSEIRRIRKGMLHVIGMCRMDKRKFTVDGNECNSETIVRMNETKVCRNGRKGKVRESRKFHSRYMKIGATYKGTPVNLFYLKYKGCSEWKLLISTDLSLSFVKVMELYRIRWSIEVMFKECKQYLRLGKAQNTDLCGQVSDVALAFATYTILSLYKRFGAYETLGGLFRRAQTETLEKTLCERIMTVFLAIVTKLLELLCVDVEESFSRIMAANSDNKEVIILLDTICQLNADSKKMLT